MALASGFIAHLILIAVSEACQVGTCDVSLHWRSTQL